MLHCITDLRAAHNTRVVPSRCKGNVRGKLLERRKGHCHLWTLLLGVVAVLIGINLLGKPLAGLITLTWVLGVMFIVSGIFKFIVGLRIHKTEFKIAVLFSGAVSLIIGLIIVSNFPASAATSLGILLGIELISNGISATALGLSRRAGGVVHEA